MWGDPHVISFEGDSYDAMELGVRDMATWTSPFVAADGSAGETTNSIQLYSCPVTCDPQGMKRYAKYGDHPHEWFPCGSSSAVGLAAFVHGHSVSVKLNEVTRRATHEDAQIPVLNSRCIQCPVHH